MWSLLSEYLLRYRGHWLVGAVATLGAAAFGLTMPWILGQAVDTFSGVETQLGWPLSWLALSLIVVALFEACSRFTARYLITGASRWVEYDLRNRYFAHLETLEPAFYRRYRTGDLVARATNDLSAVRQLYGPALYQVLNTVLLFAVALVLMFRISPSLAKWAALVLPAAGIIFAITRARIEQRFTRVQEQFAAMADHAQETFGGERVVKAYAQEGPEIESFRATSQEYVRRQIHQIRLTVLLWPTMTLVVGLLTVFMLYAGGVDVIEGQLTLGQFVQFMAYIAMLAWPMMALAWVATMWQQGVASLQRIHEILTERPRIEDGRAPTSLATGSLGDIEFRGVSVEHAGQLVLRDIDLRIPAGTTLAIVGPLGSGKSSLAALVPRLLDPTVGEVLVNGVDVRLWPVADLRRRIGFVPQETFLFSGTLRENVTFGVEPAQATESRVRGAVALSRLENDLDQWPAGLETVVGERGVTLSGGQKQRTAIARAVAREPSILILDDALSSVDTRTEAAVLTGLQEFMHHRTTLLIAHRFSTTRLADRIVVLEHGAIVEQGTHLELLELGGLYARMYRRQLMAQELDLDDESVMAEATR